MAKVKAAQVFYRFDLAFDVIIGLHLYTVQEGWFVLFNKINCPALLLLYYMRNGKSCILVIVLMCRSIILNLKNLKSYSIHDTRSRKLGMERMSNLNIGISAWHKHS